MTSIRRSLRTAALCTSALTLASPGARAAWDIVPDVALISETDDNARLLPGEQESSTRTALDARLRLRNFGQRGNAFIEPRFVTDAYSDPRDESLENDDLYLLANAEYRFSNVTLALDSDYRRESVLRAEIADAIPDSPDFEPPIDTGSGTFGTFSDERERFDLAFNVGVTLSQQSTLNLEASLIDVGYFGPQTTARTNFEDTTLRATLTRLVDQRNQVSASMYVSDYTAERNQNATDAFGVEGIFNRPLSQTWTLLLDAGIARIDYRYIDAAGGVVDNADSSFTFGIGLERAGQATAWTVAFDRSVSPNSNGFLSQRDDARIRVRHEFSPRLVGSAGLRVAVLSTAAEAAAFGERDYARATFEIEWAITQRWWLTGGVDRIAEDFSIATGQDATSNSVFLGIRYRGLAQPNPR